MHPSIKCIRATVLLVNAIDQQLAERGQLAQDQVRWVEAAGRVDPGTIFSVLPNAVADQLGLQVVGRREFGGSDGRTYVVNVVGPVVFELLGRETIDEALLLGDEVVIGQTVLAKNDLIVDVTCQRLIPNPAHPDEPVLRV